MLKVLGAGAAVLAAAAISFAAEGIPSTSITGNYIEARTADVYTGPCFANGEAELMGKEAVFGWKIASGTWHGVDLGGLSVVGAIRGPHTLGNLYEPVNPTSAVLIVDSRANAEQRLALVSFAKEQGGIWLKDVVKVDAAPIDFTVDNDNIHGGAAKLTAGSLAKIQTRAMNGADHVCGNEDVWYPPLMPLEHSMPAYALENEFKDSGLGETWSNPFKRSAFLGMFHVAAE
jgi:hypothetical protein